MDLNQAFLELKETALQLSDDLDTVSNSIRTIETTLKEKKLHILFSHFVGEVDGIETFLSWERTTDDRKSPWRLHVVDVEEGNVTHKNLLCNLKVDKRLYFLPHIDPFIKAFTQYLKELREQLEKTTLEFEDFNESL